MMDKLKRFICMLGATMCIFGTAFTVGADTIEFNVTPPEDPYSYAVRKADWEQNFYVTGTSFSDSGSLFCFSQKTTDNDVCSYSMSITPNYRRNFAPYKRTAAPNELYELVTSASISGMNVRGRYTP